MSVKICKFWDDDGKLRYTEVIVKETDTRFTLLPPYNCNEMAFRYATHLPKCCGFGSEAIKYSHTKAEAYQQFIDETLSGINNLNK